MPQTALDLGMKNIYFPAYLKEIPAIREKEMQAKNAAMASLNQINEENWALYAKQARDFMQQGLVYEQERRNLYDKYKQELLEQQNDDRLQPELVIKHAYQYFCQLLKAQKGDISLALASYNAGPHRVKQYQGIPPFAETVHYRNEVLNFFRNYLAKIDQLP
ncbi:MAG: lytic transglycosylase domain-containing protein [Desulfobacteraceae bacterium]|nr:MAG: lytic transglycosylase domain-containing protein [Desulfobacteraceae bacterium]